MSVERSVRSLSLRDVLDAREAYHVHLLNLPHVVATAVGRYLKRREEAGAAGTSVDERLELKPGVRPPRTLEGSEVHPWSWPVVVVFVDAWMDDDEIAAQPDAMVPRLLYLPDGRKVPTCVVYAPPAERSAEELEQHLSFPSDLIGGGYVCLSEVQGRERSGSIGCLVTDGDRVFALTNRHVAGVEPGRPMYSMVDGAYTLIGHTVGNSVGRLKLPEAYPGFVGTRVELAIDAGPDLGARSESVDDPGVWAWRAGRRCRTSALSRSRCSWSAPACVRLAPPRARWRARSPRFSTGTRPWPVSSTSRTRWLVRGAASRSRPDPVTRAPCGSLTAAVRRGSAARRVEPLAMQWGGHVMVTNGVRRESPYALVTLPQHRLPRPRRGDRSTRLEHRPRPLLGRGRPLHDRRPRLRPRRTRRAARLLRRQPHPHLLRPRRDRRRPVPHPDGDAVPSARRCARPVWKAHNRGIGRADTKAPTTSPTWTTRRSDDDPTTLTSMIPTADPATRSPPQPGTTFYTAKS